MYDDNGDLYAGLGTDGCDYVHTSTHEIIPYASFYTAEANNIRQSALNGDQGSLDIYTNWFSKVTEMMPSVYHYSWYDLERKIKTYKNYWSQHWQSLYNITQEDTVENNMFFDKTWSEVTDDDISSLATRLKNEMGGWVFHNKVDFNNPYPHMKLQTNQPAIMTEE